MIYLNKGKDLEANVNILSLNFDAEAGNMKSERKRTQIYLQDHLKSSNLKQLCHSI